LDEPLGLNMLIDDISLIRALDTTVNSP